MIKNIAYYPLQCARNSVPVMDAFLQSCRSAGIHTVPDGGMCDAAVIWSVLWNGRMTANQAVYREFRAQNKPVIVIDVGALQRGVTWKIAINNINALGEYGHKQGLDYARPKMLGVELQNRTKTNDNIVIATQHTKSEQLAHVDYSAWLENTIKQLSEKTDKLTVVRHHPRCNLGYDGTNVETPVKLPGTYDSYDIDFGCHAMINFNSGPAIQAVLAGCPVICDSTSLAYPMSIKLDEIDRPPEIDRSQWLVEICHTEYTVEEIRQGLWLKRLSDYLETPQ